ncbi:alpha/beta-hydrolase [Ceratobasidium sp. AG-I]|nr:alpha/beta-hydrolase [Ceratobasidium sp. AG-I]
MQDGHIFLSGPPYFSNSFDVSCQLGALGFLSSSPSYKAGALNLGVFDQARAIQWVQNYISLFGGDSAKVCHLVGESAGATSVGYHLLHVDGPTPFRGVIMYSGGPTARAFPSWHAKDYMLDYFI